jgi:hypothetical protein
MRKDNDVSDTEYKVGYGKPPLHTCFRKGKPSANARGRRRKNLAALLVDGLNKPVTGNENGRPRKGTVREAVVSQLINKSATADLRATKMLLDIIGMPRGTSVQWRRPTPLAGSRWPTKKASPSSSKGCGPRSCPKWPARSAVETWFHHRGTENTEKA